MSSINDFQSVFLHDRPLIDTRAPIEFNKGSFPQAFNLPLMSDSERQKVGTCYKKHGQDAAITLGHQLVSGEIKQQRIEAWLAFLKQHPDAYLFCFRGGLRSRISQQWIKEQAGIDCPRIAGGYKAMRRFLINTIESAAAQCQFTLLTGLTGTGKTDVLLALNDSLDLEALANHRGSSFGKHASAQPSPINFENQLAIDLLKKRQQGIERFLVENEGRLIGSCPVPLALRQRLQNVPVICLTDTLDNRIERILRDYVINLRQEFVDLSAQQGDLLFAQRLQHSLQRISRRLGLERYQRLAQIMDEALHDQLHYQQHDKHRVWIKALLEEYYDPMYQFQRQAIAQRIVFTGNRQQVLQFWQQSLNPLYG